MTFDTKIAVVLRNDLLMWQRLNVTAFMVGGLAGHQPDIVGEPYEDGSGNLYLPMVIQPILIFEADTDELRNVYERAMSRAVKLAIYTEELFATSNDIDNRAVVKAVVAEDLNLAGIALHDHKKTVDKILKGLSLHR
ncbi:MAG: DUF2000 domain-containing protein [Chloroflexi bacterium]|nr:DUF2000 domain-containing protein [Chloroflexota bacterium]